MWNIRSLKGNNLYSVAPFLLTAIALIVHVSAAFWDPFLHFWDECFHALVAKNMMDHPFTPMLHQDPALPLTESWAQNHVWLHKPPFFLWMISLSLKLFGTSVWAVRIPSAIAVSMITPIIYRMGLLVDSKRTGLIASAISICSFYLTEIANGSLNTDHNDAIFIAGICASWWTWLEYMNDQRSKWVLWTGLFAAFAILTKWYVGLLVYLPWGLIIVFERFKGIRVMISALAITIAIVSVWVLSAWYRFPDEAYHEWIFKPAHFSVPVDGHRGTSMFHLNVISELLPPFHWTISFLTIGAATIAIKKTTYRIWLVSSVVAVHLFFMLAQTKMVSYTMVLLPIYLLSIAICLERITSFAPAKLRTTVTVVLTMALAYLMADIDSLKQRHGTGEDPHGNHRKEQLAAQEMMEHVNASIGNEEKAVVFGLAKAHNIQFMFHYGHEAMWIRPDQPAVDSLRTNGYTVYLVQKSEASELEGVTVLALK